MKYVLMIMLGLATVAQAVDRPCKTDGKGFYGRSSVYDVGNPSAPKNCWQKRS